MRSQRALAALPEAARAGFRRAGAFRLKGFDEPEPIWVETGAGNPDAALRPVGR